MEIRDLDQDGTLGQMLPVIPLRVNGFIKKYQGYMCYQDDAYLTNNRLVGALQFGARRKIKLKCPNMIEDNQWKSSEKERQVRESKIQFLKKW